MKRSLLFIAMGALVLLSACTKDPWAQVAQGNWNQDRKILNIKFAGQAGLAKITDVDETTGTIDVQLATNLVSDMSSVEVTVLELSYNATSSVPRGGKMDFTANSAPVIKVTSAAGQSRIYTINMTEFTETILGCYAITQNMLWGGTGPEWGGGALMDPAAKNWCWYSDEGFGPEAEYDDYLEFTLEEIMDDGNTTGKCIHYGGVDAKHWNCLFKAKFNKEGDTDIDLHKFYRVIPVGESTWVRDYVNNTISFTDANGKVTTGRFLPADDYTVYEGKVLTVPDYAFGFDYNALTKPTEDWTNIYSDYDKFVKRPIYFFVLVSPVAEIPAASKTEGTEGKNTVEPPAPAPVFDLPGDWKVKEQWVYGGAVDRITKDQTTAKSWCWNGNYTKEMDNILTFTPSEEGGLSGTVFYGPGADGAYWDYRYVGKKAGVAVDIDCSQWYGWLPHTETTYTFRPDAITDQSPCGTVSIKISGVVTYDVPILLPGSYEFLGKTALVISEGCMALALPLADAPSTDTSYEWTDYDRFVNSPLLYVMVFQKQIPNE